CASAAWTRGCPTLTRLFALLALLALLLPGCLDRAEQVPLAPLSVQSYDGYAFQAPVAFRNGSEVALPPSVARGVEQLVPGSGGEPNIGVTSKGCMFVTTFDQVRRSCDFGRTFEVVEDLVGLAHPTTQDEFSTADPMLWVDPDTDRVFANQMSPALLCTWMSWSDQNGEKGSWTERPFDCTTPMLDHQKVMTSKPAAGGPPMLAYPNVVYMCVNKRLDVLGIAGMGTSCMMSYDGGMSFPLEREVYVNDGLCGNINGHPASFPDGTGAVALGDLGPACERPLTVVVTEDNGLTWTVRQCDPKLGQVEIDADITVTPDGTAYMLYRDHDQIAHLLRSKDKFRTCQSFRVAPPDHQLSQFTAITSGDDGRIAMAYLGTRDPQLPGAAPSNATLGSKWHLFVTTSFDAEAEAPTFVTTQVTPEQA